jgi:hypothetical protein
MKKSLKLEQKLTNRFTPDPIVSQVETLLVNADDPATFKNSDELKSYLSEGALLAMNKIGENALSVPCGEYMVWTTSYGNTVLVPSSKPTDEVFEDVKDYYEVFTPDLVNVFTGVEKVLAEDESKPTDSTEDPKHGGFTSKIHMSSVDRTPIVRAMEQHGHTVSSLADACGVDPPAISRILRTPKQTQGDPGGRNPSIGLAAKIANELKMDAEALFPDIFGVPKGDLEARDTPGNRGSGMKGAAAGSQRKGGGTDKWTQGNS